MPIKKKEVIEHIRVHADYPATKKQLIEWCNNMSDVPKEDREWFKKNLPERTYYSAEEVIKALKL
jgi:hypothetical protein